AMPSGGIITLRARSAGRFVAFDVIDTGTGIPLHQIPKIFNLFYSTKGSTGFGLWSALRLARRQGGNLQVQSQQGVGSTFTLLLPWEAPERISDPQIHGDSEGYAGKRDGISEPLLQVAELMATVNELRER